MAISMLKIRRPLGRLIFNMGIAIPGKTVFLIETAPRSSGLSLQGYSYNSHCTVTIPHECIFYELVMSNASPGGKELEYGVTAFYGTKVVKSISGMISLTSDKVVRQHLLEVVRWSNPHVQLGCMSSTTALVLQALHLKNWLSCFG